MKFSLAQVLLLLATAAAAQPAELNKRTCVVNSAKIDEWVEDGLTRFRTAFSSEGTPTNAYCHYWGVNACSDSISNVQCYYNTVVGSWVVDSNWPRGPVGDSTYYKCVDNTRADWIADTGCTTG